MKIGNMDRKAGISALHWNVNSPAVSWKWGGKKIEKVYGHRLFKVLLLKDRQSIAIIASTKDEGAENAGIYNADGSLRYKIKIPSIKPICYGFCDVYYEKDELRIILMTGSRDYPYDTGCSFNPETGEIRNCHNVK